MLEYLDVLQPGDIQKSKSASSSQNVERWIIRVQKNHHFPGCTALGPPP